MDKIAKGMQFRDGWYIRVIDNVIHLERRDTMGRPYYQAPGIEPRIDPSSPPRVHIERWRMGWFPTSTLASWDADAEAWDGRQLRCSTFGQLNEYTLPDGRFFGKWFSAPATSVETVDVPAPRIRPGQEYQWTGTEYQTWTKSGGWRAYYHTGKEV